MDTIEARFARPEPRRRVRDFVAGLLAPLPVKNCWTITEPAGDNGPGGMQDLIGRASWDDALVRADIRAFVAARLGHPDGGLTQPAITRSRQVGDASRASLRRRMGQP